MGLRPADFWSLSALEWSWLTAAAAPQPLSLGEAQALARRYPDAPPARPAGGGGGPSGRKLSADAKEARA
jgi:hypothetical protein